MNKENNKMMTAMHAVIKEEYTSDNFIDKVFEDNTNASYDETIQAMAKAIDEIKYDEDTIEDDLISEAASRIASAYGTDVVSAYDDLINAQDEKYANHSYPSVDDLEGTYGGPLDEKLISRWNNKWDSKGNFVITKSGKKISKGDKDKDGDYVTGFNPESNSIFIDSDPNVDGGADYDVNEYEDEIVDTKIKESNESNKFNDFGKTWSVFKIHMHGSEPEQEVAKGLSSREAASKVTSLRAAEKDKDISYVSRSAEHSKFIKDHQKPITNNVKESYGRISKESILHSLKDKLANTGDSFAVLSFAEGDWVYEDSASSKEAAIKLADDLFNNSNFGRADYVEVVNADGNGVYSEGQNPEDKEVPDGYEEYEYSERGLKKGTAIILWDGSRGWVVDNFNDKFIWWTPDRGDLKYGRGMLWTLDKNEIRYINNNDIAKDEDDEDLDEDFEPMDSKYYIEASWADDSDEEQFNDYYDCETPEKALERAEKFITDDNAIQVFVQKVMRGGKQEHPTDSDYFKRNEWANMSNTVKITADLPSKTKHYYNEDDKEITRQYAVDLLTGYGYADEKDPYAPKEDEDDEDLDEDFKDRQKSIRCLKDLGKNYNFDRFSDQQLYVMCKKAQREAQQLAQERAEMEDELENCPEAQTCPQCGGPLNDAGECPKCDLGDENESLKEDERKINSQSEKETSFEDINVGDGFDEISFWDENSVLGHVGDDAVMRAVLHLAKKYYIYNHDKIKGYGADDALVNAYEHIDNNGVWFDPTVEEDNQLKDALKDWIDYPGTPAPDFKDEEAEFSKSLDAACKQYKLFDFISDKVNDKNTAKEMCLAFLGVIDDDQHLSDTSTRERLANLMEDNMNDQGAIDACNSYTLFDYIAENYYSMSLEDLKELAETFLDAIDDWMTLNSKYTMQTIRDEFVNRDLIIESSR